MASVLIIDDDPLVRRTLCDGLQHHDHQARTAASFVEAIAMIQAERPDIIVSDVLMPDKDGLEVLRDVRARWPGLPVIVISGGGKIRDDDLLAYAQGLGASATFTKPLKLSELSSKIASIVG
jgi:DNA-binding response OmpR family regulator